MSEQLVDTPQGPARLVSHPAVDPFVTLLLSHGAGGGLAAPDLQALAARLPEQGASVVLLEQPWRLSGRRIATAPPTLDEALVACAATLHQDTPLVVGGRSAGARSAARCAAGLGAAGCLALSFPLHPPGRPEKTRLAELAGSGVPTLVIQGDKDAFGGPDEFPDLDHVDLAVVPGADHRLTVARSAAVSQAEAIAIVVESTLEWLVREVGVAGDVRGE